MFMRRGVLSAAVLTLALAPAAALSGCDGDTETAEEPESQVDQNGTAEQQAEQNGAVEPEDEMNGDGAPEDEIDGGTEPQAEEPPAEPENGTDGDVQE